MSISMLFGLTGGLGLFIYGMKQMSQGLQKLAGRKLRHFLAMLTTRPILGVLMGTGVTAVFQSSTATTVMIVGFVNAGIMTLAQSIGVIMGANIGTTVTAQIISFELGDYAFHAITIGAFAYLFANNKKVEYLGQILLGFGILFLGLNTMSETMYPLRDSAVFVEMMERFSAYPILGVFIGIIVTVVVQSSTATFGILLGLVSVGVIDYSAGIPILLGSNIGTTITAILSSLGANLTAKRAAAAHTIFNVLGAGVLLSLLYIIPDFSGKMYSLIDGITNITDTPLTTERLLANTHTVFNVANTLIWFPFVGFMERVVCQLFPGEDPTIKRGLKYIDERMLSTPGVAVSQVQKEIIRMHEIARDMVCEAVDAFQNIDTKLADSVIRKEEIVNELEEEILVFLTQVPQGSLSDFNIRTIDMYFGIIDAIESIADDADDMADFTYYRKENNVEFSEDAEETFETLAVYICDLLEKSIKLIEEEDEGIARELIAAEEEMDRLQVKYREDHMQRLNEGTCSPNAGIVFMEAIEDLEHITDQFADMAHSILER